MNILNSHNIVENTPGVNNFILVDINNIHSISSPILGVVNIVFTFEEDDIIYNNLTDGSSEFTEEKNTENEGTIFKYSFSGLIPKDSLELRNEFSTIDTNKYILICIDANLKYRLLGNIKNPITITTALTKQNNNTYNVEFSWHNTERAYFMTGFYVEPYRFNPVITIFEKPNYAFVDDTIEVILRIENTGTSGDKLTINFDFGNITEHRTIFLNPNQLTFQTFEYTATGIVLGKMPIKISWLDQVINTDIYIRSMFLLKQAANTTLNLNYTFSLFDTNIAIDPTTLIINGTCILTLSPNNNYTLVCSLEGTLNTLYFKDILNNEYKFVFTEGKGDIVLNVHENGKAEAAYFSAVNWMRQDNYFHIWEHGGTKLFNADDHDQFMFIPNDYNNNFLYQITNS